jgi:hypothetical protein
LQPGLELTGDRLQEPGATSAHAEFSRRWREMPKAFFSKTLEEVGGSPSLLRSSPEMKALKESSGRAIQGI